MSRIREDVVTRACLKYLNSIKGAKFVKRHVSEWNQAGEPDIFGCIDGQHFEFEIKAPGKKPEKLQTVRLQEWENAGAIVGWFDNVEKLKLFMMQKGY